LQSVIELMSYPETGLQKSFVRCKRRFPTAERTLHNAGNISSTGERTLHNAGDISSTGERTLHNAGDTPRAHNDGNYSYTERITRHTIFLRLGFQF
jgi:hypothetical protein